MSQIMVERDGERVPTQHRIVRRRDLNRREAGRRLMRMLFTSGPASGHFHPLVPIALAARDAGHDVCFALAPSACCAVERLGFAVAPAGADLDDPAIECVREEVLADPTKAISMLFAGVCAERMLPDLHAAVERWRPDIVISEMTEFASWVVAEKHGIPRVTIPFGMHWPPDAIESMGGGPALQALRRRAGLDPEPWLQTLAAQPRLLFAPPGYQFPGVTLPAHVHLFRPAIFDQSGEETLPGWVHGRPDRPLVYATLGTAYNNTVGVLEATIEAARDEAFDLVVTVGRNRDPTSLGSLPANVRVERYIPQSLLLPHCDAVVSHGGYSTVMATLSNGLPMILTPIGADQPFHADRCRELGVAIVVEPNAPSPRGMREAIRQALDDPSYRLRAQAVREEMMQLPGVDRAVQLLEELGSAG